MSASLAELSLDVLRRAHIELRSGLSDREIARVEEVGRFQFTPDHRELLQLALPTGERWPDWRGDTADQIAKRLSWPLLMFDPVFDWNVVTVDDYRRLRGKAGHIPVLVPIYSHRFTPAAPAPSGSPVFSVYDSDIIHYGDDLLDDVSAEFLGSAGGRVDRSYVPFWTEFIDEEAYDPDSDATRAFWAADKQEPSGGNPLTGN